MSLRSFKYYLSVLLALTVAGAFQPLAFAAQSSNPGDVFAVPAAEKTWIIGNTGGLAGYYKMDYFENVFAAPKLENTVFDLPKGHDIEKQDAAIQEKDSTKVTWNILPMLNRHTTSPITLDTLFPIVLTMPIGVTLQLRY